jgi:hypothetical protein
MSTPAFYYDISSPWSWTGSTRLQRNRPNRYGPRIHAAGVPPRIGCVIRPECRVAAGESYPVGVALSERHLRAGEAARAYLAAQPPEAKRRAAGVVRELAKGLESARQRAAAESVARRLEGTDYADHRSPSSPAV